ncbi:hypothetical protein PsorP6_014548 [Peronosclerospora sorghi]|uniref:Uncharacterized protein n=1 Tax=Peronosclerospora sorghi TaxID=230839 RepID=A0ACC0VSA6_9STRA|nr:hypothetical protein PsorP6_014548 [Peronosclerospora sorghi]
MQSMPCLFQPSPFHNIDPKLVLLIAYDWTIAHPAAFDVVAFHSLRFLVVCYCLQWRHLLDTRRWGSLSSVNTSHNDDSSRPFRLLGPGSRAPTLSPICIVAVPKFRM